MTIATADNASSFRKTVSDTGIRVVTSAVPGVHSVSISIFVLVGSRYESVEVAGISHFVEHLVFKGTKKRPTAEEISRTIEGFGGEINAGTEQELTVYWCQVAKPHVSESLNLMLDMLRNSVYDPEDFEREKGVILEEQNMINDYPQQRLELLLDDLLWPGHPLGRDVSGTSQSITSITREMVLDHVRRFYTPANMVVSVAGDIDHEEVVAQVEEMCDGWTARPAPAWVPFNGRQADSRISVENRKIGQSNVAIGMPGLSATHPNRHALDMLSVVLGEGMSSRLFLEVRERQGLAYDVFSTTAHFLDCGAFVVGAGVDPKRVYEAIATLMKEIGRLRGGITDEELERAKTMSAGRIMLRLEGTRAVSGWIGGQEALLGRIANVDDVVDGINAVSAEDVRRVASDLLQTEKLHLAVVGPHRGKTRFERALRFP